VTYSLNMSGGKDKVVRADGSVVFELAHGDPWTVPLLLALNGERQPAEDPPEESEAPPTSIRLKSSTEETARDPRSINTPPRLG
jgi:hypothetical protein